MRIVESNLLADDKDDQMAEDFEERRKGGVNLHSSSNCDVVSENAEGPVDEDMVERPVFLCPPHTQWLVSNPPQPGLHSLEHAPKLDHVEGHVHVFLNLVLVQKRRPVHVHKEVEEPESPEHDSAHALHANPVNLQCRRQKEKKKGKKGIDGDFATHQHRAVVLVEQRPLHVERVGRADPPVVARGQQGSSVHCASPHRAHLPKRSFSV